MRKFIEETFLRIDKLNGNDPKINAVIDEGIKAINKGDLRAAERINGEWVVNEWVKKMILIYFHITPSQIMPTGYRMHQTAEVNASDKIHLRTSGWTDDTYKKAGFRMVPGAILRTGAYIAPSVVLMPSFVNIGAYVGSGTMIDTWATVGSCAQIGERCHISGGAGIGGVLEPLNARPVIIEDNVFIGARSEVAEGVIVRQGAVISMGVFLGASTPIINRMTGEISYGEVPQNAVVLPGSRPVRLPNNETINMPCAIITKFADEGTRVKVSLNDLVRD